MMVGVDVTIPLERAIVDRITRRLKDEPSIWLLKVHGSSFGRRGIPDIIGCLSGQMFALEVKRPSVGRVSPSQMHNMMKMADAGAVVAVVESVEDALEVLGL